MKRRAKECKDVENVGAGKDSLRSVVAVPAGWLSRDQGGRPATNFRELSPPSRSVFSASLFRLRARFRRTGIEDQQQVAEVPRLAVWQKLENRDSGQRRTDQLQFR